MATAGSERSDAARNREAILAAADDLFSRFGDEVSTNDIATAAGVGKGTLFRRFGDRTALIEAVLARRATALLRLEQEDGAPFGPGGGDPGAAVRAYLDVLLDFVWSNRGLIRALEQRGPHALYANPAAEHWIAELARRVAAARPGEDAEVLAHALFSALSADLVDFLVTVRAMPLERFRAGLHALATPSHTPDRQE
jgi:AcrR family transcriptional regulator